MTTLVKNEIRMLARKSVQEAITAEMSRIRGTFVLSVSKKEQNDIEKLYKKPSQQFVRMLRITL